MAKDLIVIAVLLGAHGVRGDCRIKSFTGEPESVLTYGPLSDADGKVLVTPKRARPAKDHFIITPEESRQKEDWDALKGTLLHVARDVLPETEEDEVYIDELIGVSVFDLAGKALGSVKAVHNFGAGDLLEIDRVDQVKSVMVPFTEEDVPEIDLASGKIVMAHFDVWADEGHAPEADMSQEQPSKKLKR